MKLYTRSFIPEQLPQPVFQHCGRWRALSVLWGHSPDLQLHLPHKLSSLLWCEAEPAPGTLGRGGSIHKPWILLSGPVSQSQTLNCAHLPGAQGCTAKSSHIQQCGHGPSCWGELHQASFLQHSQNKYQWLLESTCKKNTSTL